MRVGSRTKIRGFLAVCVMIAILIGVSFASFAATGSVAITFNDTNPQWIEVASNVQTGETVTVDLTANRVSTLNSIVEFKLVEGQLGTADLSDNSGAADLGSQQLSEAYPIIPPTLAAKLETLQFVAKKNYSSIYLHVRGNGFQSSGVQQGGPGNQVWNIHWTSDVKAAAGPTTATAGMWGSTTIPTPVPSTFPTVSIIPPPVVPPIVPPIVPPVIPPPPIIPPPAPPVVPMPPMPTIPAPTVPVIRPPMPTLTVPTTTQTTAGPTLPTPTVPTIAPTAPTATTTVPTPTPTPSATTTAATTRATTAATTRVTTTTAAMTRATTTTAATTRATTTTATTTRTPSITTSLIPVTTTTRTPSVTTSLIPATTTTRTPSVTTSLIPATTTTRTPSITTSLISATTTTRTPLITTSIIPADSTSTATSSTTTPTMTGSIGPTGPTVTATIVSSAPGTTQHSQIMPSYSQQIQPSAAPPPVYVPAYPNTSPKTGDTENMALYAVILMSAVAIGGTAIVIQKKKKANRK